MSGHSKWATIRHKKGALDAKRGKLFTKIIREITVAARNGGDPSQNPQLRSAILKARVLNMPNDNIDRAIKKGVGNLDTTAYEEIVYEGYGPGGIALLIICLTDNRKRTAADVRSKLSKNGGNLGESGCVSYLFSRKGFITVATEQYSEDTVLEAALDADVENIISNEEYIEITTMPEAFEQVLTALDDAQIKYETASILRIPETTVTLDATLKEKALRLLDILEDCDDVQEVACNIEYASNTGD